MTETTESPILENDNIALIVDDQHIFCKRQQLIACSPYFQAMFDSQMRESNLSEVSLHGVKPAILQDLVDFAQTGKCTITSQNVQSLLETSCMYQFEKVINLCCKFLLDHLDSTNCLGIAYFSRTLNLKLLYEKTMAYALWHFKHVCEEVEFLELEGSQIQSYLSHKFLKIADELLAYKAFIKWIEHDPKSRESEFCNLIKVLCYRNIDYKIVENEISQHAHVNFCIKCKKFFQEIFNWKNDFKNQVEPSKFDQVCRYSPIFPVIIGGDYMYENKVPNPNILYFDSKTKKCTKLTKLPMRKQLSVNMGYKVTVIGSHLYILGGEFMLGRSQWLMNVWRYDSLLDNWEIVTRLLQPRRHHVLCSIENFIYLIGGFGKHRVMLDSVERYDTVTGEWERLPPLIKPTFSAAAAHANNKLYVFRHEIQSFNLETMTWSLILTGIPKQIGIHGALVQDSNIFLIGQYTPSLIKFNPIIEEAEEVGKFEETTGSACILDNKLYIFAGEFTKNVESYSLTTGSFEVVTELKYLMMNHECAILPIYDHLLEL